jgi:hypothetical protein
MSVQLPQVATLRGKLDETGNIINLEPGSAPADSYYILEEQASVATRDEIGEQPPDGRILGGSAIACVGVFRPSVQAMAAQHAKQQNISVAQAYREDDIYNNARLVFAQFDDYGPRVRPTISLFATPWINRSHSGDRRATDQQLQYKGKFTPFLQIHDWTLVEFGVDFDGDKINDDPTDEDLLQVWQKIYNNLHVMASG